MSECDCYKNAMNHMYEIVGERYVEHNNCKCRCHEKKVENIPLGTPLGTPQIREWLEEWGRSIQRRSITSLETKDLWLKEFAEKDEKIRKLEAQVEFLSGVIDELRESKNGPAF